MKTYLLLLFILFCFTTVQGQIEIAAAATATINPTYEQQVLTLVNQRRASWATCGSQSYPPVPPLTWNQSLGNAARGHSIDMADKNYFSHTSADGRTFVQRIVKAGYYPYLALGENIAAGYTTPSAVVSGWMSSPGHCANIMSANFKEVGVGYAYNSLSSYKHYWTQDFGRRS